MLMPVFAWCRKSSLSAILIELDRMDDGKQQSPRSARALFLSGWMMVCCLLADGLPQRQLSG